MRPVVKTALRRLWRDSTTLQIGVHHERAVVFAGIGEQVGRLLAAFDGAHDRSALRARARSLGLDASIVDRLVSMLTAALCSTMQLPTHVRSPRCRALNAIGSRPTSHPCHWFPGNSTVGYRRCRGANERRLAWLVGVE